MNINYNNLNSLTFEEAKEIFINRAIMPNGFSDGEAWRYAVKKISDMLESGELKEPKTGRWIDKTHQSGCGVHFMHIECSECGEPSGLNNAYARYCPWCGTKMIRSQESEVKL